MKKRRRPSRRRPVPHSKRGEKPGENHGDGSIGCPEGSQRNTSPWSLAPARTTVRSTRSKPQTQQTARFRIAGGGRFFCAQKNAAPGSAARGRGDRVWKLMIRKCTVEPPATSMERAPAGAAADSARAAQEVRTKDRLPFSWEPGYEEDSVGLECTPSGIKHGGREHRSSSHR